MATASATHTSSRTSPSIRRRTSAIGGAFYAVAPAPDGSIWGSVLGFPGAVVRLVPGSNPPETALAEVYEPPFDNPKAPVQGFSPRGMDIDRNGVDWAALASGHMASFDRRKCKGPLNGPTATGQHCPEGWTLYAEPLPQMKGVTDIGQRRRQLLHLGRSVRHVRPGCEHADQYRQRVGRAARPQGWQVGRAARAVSARLLHEVDGRTHRRCEGRMEGERPLDDDQHACAVPHGDREGDDEQGDEIPDAPESDREVGGRGDVRVSQTL